MIELLKSAIGSRQRVRLFYEPGGRIIEPHTLGYGSSGQILLRAFQVEGASASREHQNWKLFRLDRIENADLDPTAFSGPREGYRRGDSHMKGGIIA
jgi:predicted DNA-binding transcriptional regulator YafY